MTPGAEHVESSATARATLVARALAFAVCVGTLASEWLGQLPNLQHRAILVGATLTIGLVLHPLAVRGRWRRLGRAVDSLLVAIAVLACGYVVLNYWSIVMDQASAGTPTAVALGIALSVVVLELARRTIGWTFGLLVAVFTLYALLGHLIPGRLGHGGTSWQLLAELVYLGTDGVWGPLTDIYVSLLIPFTIFSGLMMATGVGESFLEFAKLACGRMRGGPAKIAVLGSALVGSVTGSSVANVAMTGTFTIPLMKRSGYRSEVAGAIEATASSGGQITPPLMGAGLFLMAEMLHVDVPRMMLIALVPALVFYVGVYAAVHFESLRERMQPIPAAEVPRAAAFLRFGVWGPLFLPFVVLVAAMIAGYSASRSVTLAILTLVLAYLAAAGSLAGLRERVRVVARGLAGCADGLVTVGSLVVAASILVGLIGFYGIGTKFTELMIEAAAGNLPLSLLMAAAIVLVIGMGVPTTAAYVLSASVIAGAMLKLGVAELPAHMFIFYFATLSAITPPVCAAVFVAAGIADAPWGKVAWQTVRFAVIKYFLPFLFIFHPELLLQGSGSDALVAFVFVSVGTVFLAAALARYLFRDLAAWESTLLAAIAVAILWPERISSLAGLALAAGFLVWVRRRERART